MESRKNGIIVACRSCKGIWCAYTTADQILRDIGGRRVLYGAVTVADGRAVGQDEFVPYGMEVQQKLEKADPGWINKPSNGALFDGWSHVIFQPFLILFIQERYLLMKEEIRECKLIYVKSLLLARPSRSGVFDNCDILWSRPTATADPSCPGLVPLLNKLRNP